MVRIHLVLATLLLTGCNTFGGGGSTITLVTTEPPDATVRVDGFGECQSPCTIEIDAARNITIAKAGYEMQRLVLKPGKKKLEVTLELSAPTTEVDEAEMPEL